MWGAITYIKRYVTRWIAYYWQMEKNLELKQTENKCFTLQFHVQGVFRSGHDVLKH